MAREWAGIFSGQFTRTGGHVYLDWYGQRWELPRKAAQACERVLEEEETARLEVWARKAKFREGGQRQWHAEKLLDDP